MPELLVSTFVLGVFVVSLYAGFSSGFAMLRLAREDARATQIVLQKVEQIRLCTWSQLNTFPVSFQEKFNPLDTTSAKDTVVFNGTINFSTPDLSTTYQTNLKVVTVTVYWTNNLGKGTQLHTNQMQTQVARYGMQNYDWEAK